MEGLIEGRVVHYTQELTPFVDAEGKGSMVPSIDNRKEHLAASVAHVYKVDPKAKEDKGLVDLKLVVPRVSGAPGMNDFVEKVAYDESGKPGTWHWIPKA